MYRMLSAQEIINNIVALSLPFVNNKEPLAAPDLKLAHQKFLRSLQPHCPILNPEQLFYADCESEMAFENYFIREEIEYKHPALAVNLSELLYKNPLHRKLSLEQGLEQLSIDDPVFVALFKLTMNIVFCTTSNRLGGTSVNPRFIGVMCAHQDMNAERLAIPELFIHEFTHQALFLDDLRYGHYHHELMKEPKAFCDIHYNGANYPVSLHRCLHSLIVNAEVLMARDAFIGHQPRISQHLPSCELIHRANIYLAAINDNRYALAVMKDRAMELFEKCQSVYSQY